MILYLQWQLAVQRDPSPHWYRSPLDRQQWHEWSSDSYKYLASHLHHPTTFLSECNTLISFNSSNITGILLLNLKSTWTATTILECLSRLKYKFYKISHLKSLKTMITPYSSCVSMCVLTSQWYIGPIQAKHTIFAIRLNPSFGNLMTYNIRGLQLIFNGMRKS